MTRRSNTTYQDPSAAGSLSSALRQWQDLRASGRDLTTIRIGFTLACWSESRAARVGASLRRRRACAVTGMHRIAEAPRDTWHVQGSTHAAVHSLADLESIWTWLHDAARSHQVALIDVAVAPAAA